MSDKPLSLEDDEPRPVKRRSPKLPPEPVDDYSLKEDFKAAFRGNVIIFLTVMKFIAAGVGFIFALIALNDNSAVRVGAYAGLACFCGIVARLIQAEEHRLRK